MAQEVIEITEREIEIIEVIERGPVGPTGPQPDINYEVVSSARTLEAADLIAADTSGGAFTLTLPANPSNGDAVDIFDFSETFDTNPLTIARNGQPIESLNEDLVANVEGAYFTLIYTGSTRGWQVLPRYGTSGGGGESALTTQGDMLYRGVGINTRLPIGSAGQILKVNSGATAPEWGAAPATGVTSVGVSGSDGIEVDSGSPITGSGTIALGVNAASLRSHINVADGANNYTHPNHSGEVTSSGDGATTIANDVVTNAKLANVATATIKGRATAGTGDPEDLTASQVRTILNVADGAEVNVQSNWTEADSGSDAFILNKPTLGGAAALNVGTTTGTVCAGDDARLSDSRTPTAHAASHAVGAAARFSGQVAGMTGNILIVADNAGTAGNSITLTFDGIDDITTILAAWNSANPSNQATVLSGDDGQIPDNGEEITLSGGAAAGSDPITDPVFDSVGVGGSPVGSERKFHQHGGKFTVESDSGSFGQFQVVNPTAGEVTFVMASDGGTETDGTLTATLPENIWAFGLGPYGNNPTDFCIGNNSGNSVFHIKPDGKVGLGSGNADPVEALDVWGNIAMRDLDNDFAATFEARGNLTANRVYDLPDASGTLALVGDAPASHAHGNITNGGLVGTTANLPLKTGTGGIVEAGVFGTGAGEFAEGNHTHTQLHDKSHSMTDATSHTAGNHKVFYSDGSGQIQELALGNSGEVLTSNGATSAPSFAAASGGVTAVGASTADVLSVSGSDLVADDGGTIDSSDPFIKWDDAAGKLVYANPLSRPSGAFYVGVAPSTTAVGTNSIDIQTSRGAASRIASGASSICIGREATGGGNYGIAIGDAANAGTFFSNNYAIGFIATAIGNTSIAFGYNSSASASQSSVFGHLSTATATRATALGYDVDASLRGQLQTRPFSSVYWGGETTNNTATILNLDATATNRFTIAANTALAVDVLLVARRSDTADKWLVARRFLGIRRDGSNNTSLIGSVQTLGTDQSEGSPSWSFTLTADDTNEALQLEVTGAASETVQWRATAFYRVV